jgi:hypothetical protein
MSRRGLRFIGIHANWTAVSIQNLLRLLKGLSKEREILLDHANFAFFGRRNVEREPSTFEEVWNHDDPRSIEKWREAINKEFEEMEKKQVCEVMKNKTFLKIEEQLSAIGSSRSRETGSSELDW